MTIHILYVRMLLLHFAFVTESQSGSFAKSPLPYLPCCRAVTDSINELLNVCSTSGPGQKECDNALRKIEVYMCYMTQPEKLSAFTYNQPVLPCGPYCYCQGLNVVRETQHS